MRFHKLLANYVYNKNVGKTYNILSGLLCRLVPKIFADFKVVLGRYQFVTSGIWYYKFRIVFSIPLYYNFDQVGITPGKLYSWHF